MKIIKDGNSVFVANENFENLQESPAVFGELRDFVGASVVAMDATGTEKITVYLNADELQNQVNRADGKIARIRIDWVEANAG